MSDHDPIAERTDEELARQAGAGSSRSFEELANRYKRRLFAYLRPRLGSDQDAEDAVQDTFLKLYRNIGSYDPSFRFSTWLYTSANRLAIDAFRKGAAARTMRAMGRIDDLPDPAAGDKNESGGSGLWDAARTLGESRFRVLWLRYGEEMTIEEIAAVLGRTQMGVRMLLHRARTGLAGKLGPDARRVARSSPKVAKGAAGD
jgi:RNA polymerase sigma-70 factor, ECF subfamily